MAINDRAADDGHDRAAKPRTRVFTVRLWTEGVAGRSEYRGTVQEIVSRSFHNFRDWSDLTAFMIERMEDNELAQTRNEGGAPWLSEKRP
jgi:hypothetical protein